MMTVETDRLVDEREAASILSCKPQTMSVWRLRGTGPIFIKVGRLTRYRLSDLAKYIEARACHNTAEADALEV